ncbi:glycosyl transferase family 1 [Arthrobacter sp. Soil782]|nr:glycosyl transferase family 1 [Arthrobacter sp. Soil782]
MKRLRQYIPGTPTTMRRMHLELSFGARLLFARWGNPDVVLMVTPALFSSALALLRLRLSRRRPAIGIWVQDIYSRGLEEIRQGSSTLVSMMRRLEGLVLRSATGVCVIHERFRDYAVTGLGVRNQDVVVIRNWTHIAVESSIDRSAVRERLGWADHDVVVLHAGNMGAKQGLENVVRAAAISDQSRSRVRFALLGDGNQRRHIEDIAQGINRIQFIDPLPDDEFEAALSAADMLLVNELPGLRETAVPSKLTSYFATGLPVVAATDVNSTTAGELAKSRGGVRIEPDNPSALVQIAETLAADQELSQALGHAGRMYATNYLSEDAAILAHGAWLHSLRASKNTASSTGLK